MTFLTNRNDGVMVGDVLAGIVGLLFVLAPWYVGFAEGAAAWNAWIVGAAAIVVALIAYLQANRYLSWAYIVLGLWAIAAPWALGFAAIAGALYAHLIAGAVLVVLRAYEAWRSSGDRPFSTP